MSNTPLLIDPFFPKPKTFKEYVFAQSMGLIFEMPKIDTVFSIKAYIGDWTPVGQYE